MKENEFLKNFAKMLGADDKLREIEERRLKEKRMLESLSAQLGVALVEEQEQEREVPAALVQQPVEETFEEIVQQVELVEDIVSDPVEEIVENVIPELPQLPVDTIVTKSVEKIAKVAPKDIQKAVDDIPSAMRREIDALKKSITDLHRFAARHSQLGGGGAGDVISLDHQTTTVYGNYVIGRHDYYVGVGVTPATITLPAVAKDGRYVIIKDEVGNCSSNPITVLGNVDNDPGGFVLAQDNGGIQMIFNNGGWRIV